MKSPKKNSKGYFDYAASNPLWPEAALAMSEAMEIIGNPSATHAFGQKARKLLDDSRNEVAEFLGVDAKEVIFTSGATEANNLFLRGAIEAILRKKLVEKPKVLTSILEHSSVNKPLQRLKKQGKIVLEYMPVTQEARVDLDKALEMIDDQTALICLTAANNVLGSVQPLAEIGKIVFEKRKQRIREGSEVPLMFFSDAVQAAAWMQLKPKDWNLDALVISGHKVGGPKGVGVLWIRDGLEIDPIVLGGGQEKGLRSGTENLSAIAGMAAVLEKAADTRDAESQRYLELRKKLVAGIAETRSETRILGSETPNALPSIVYVHIPKIEGDVLAIKLDVAGYAVSTGSACDSGQRSSPAILEEIYGQQVSKWGGVRISFGRFTDENDIIGLIKSFSKI